MLDFGMHSADTDAVRSIYVAPWADFGLRGHFPPAISTYLDNVDTVFVFAASCIADEGPRTVRFIELLMQSESVTLSWYENRDT